MAADAAPSGEAGAEAAQGGPGWAGREDEEEEVGGSVSSKRPIVFSHARISRFCGARGLTREERERNGPGGSVRCKGRLFARKAGKRKLQLTKQQEKEIGERAELTSKKKKGKQ